MIAPPGQDVKPRSVRLGGRLTLGVVDSGDVCSIVQDGNVLEAREDGWIFGPRQEIFTRRNAQLRSIEVVARVCQVKSAIDSDNSRILGATARFPRFRRVKDGFIQPSEIVAVLGPSQAD